MKKKREPSILNRFSNAYLIEILLAFTLSAFIFLGITYANKERVFLKRIDKHTKTFAQIIAYPLWAYDFDSITRYSKVFLNNSDVCAIRVYDESGKTVSFQSSPCYKDIFKKGLEERVIYPVIFNSKKIGSVEIFYTKKNLQNFVYNFILLISSLGIILIIVLMIGSRYLINNYILYPLNIFSQTIKEVKSGSYNVNTEISSIKFREFSELFNQINEMIEAIKNREEELKEVNQELNILIESMPDGFVLMDLSGTVLQVNNRFLEMFRYSEERIKGVNIYEFSDPSLSKSRMVSYFEKTLETGFQSFRWKGKTKDGRIFWILVHLNLISLKGEKYLLGLVLDIDEEVKLEKNLKESEERFRKFTEHTKAAVFLYSEYFEYVNPATCQILGYSEEELLKMHFWDVVHPEERLIVKERGLKRIEGEDIVPSYEFRVVRKDGKIRWIEFVADHIELNKKKLALGTAIDITPRKIYQENLKEEKEKLAATLKSIAEGVIVLDEKGKIKIVNKAAERLFNKKESELENESCHDILQFYYEDEIENTKDIKKLSLSFKEIIEGYQNNDLFLFNEKGEKVFVSVSGSPVKIGNKVYGGIVVINDITEHELFKREIVKQQKLESLATLAAGIAHDFNNLLQILQGNIELALIKSSDELKPVLERAQASLKKATGLAQKLLTFAKGGAPIKKKIEDFEAFLKNTVELFLAGTSIKAIIEVDKDLFPVEADPTQLEQVFNNILTNARDILKDNGVLKIKAENFFYNKKEHPGLPLKERFTKYVHITIEDNGPGIPADVIERIFEPYFTTKKYGTGLGLAVAYSVITKHEGYITAENKPEGGAIFHIYLPVKEILEGFSQSELKMIEKRDLSPKKAKGKESVDFSKLNILFMDDDKDIREIAEDYAFALGCNIVCVSDGKEAVETYKKALEKGEKFDLVFVDLTVVGGMGGEKTLEELKKIDPEVKVVVSSGYAHSAAMSDFKDRGFINVLPKPYLLEDFKRVIIESLSN